jgi:hypothetical protein
MARKCRDCSKCTERGIKRFTKKVANAALITGTLGGSAVASKGVKAVRELCPICNHPLAWHEIVDGRFKD